VRRALRVHKVRRAHKDPRAIRVGPSDHKVRKARKDHKVHTVGHRGRRDHQVQAVPDSPASSLWFRALSARVRR
jgi:hypothetical protein